MLKSILFFFRDFGSILNAGLIVSLSALILKVLHATIAQKDEHIALLQDNLKKSELFSAKNVNEQFKALKEWYDRSIKTLEEEKEKAIDSREVEFQRKIEDEMDRRHALLSRFTSNDEATALPQPSLDEVSGLYNVTGYNPGIPEENYLGDLEIRRDGDTLWARWSISGEHHEGIGLLKGNLLAFTFIRKVPPGSQRRTRPGVVLYELLTPEIMRGKWTAMGKDKIGFEECRKNQDNN